MLAINYIGKQAKQLTRWNDNLDRSENYSDDVLLINADVNDIWLLVFKFVE